MPANNVATSNDSFISIALAPNSLTRPFVCLILDLNLPLLVNVQGPCATDLVDMLQRLRAEPSRVRITCLGEMVANYRISAEVFRERDPSGEPAVYEWTLRGDAQTAQQLEFTRTTARNPISLRGTCLIGYILFNPRGLRARQKTEEHHRELWHHRPEETVGQPRTT